MPLFPENYDLPILTSDQIRAKITSLHLTDYDVPKILDHIAITIQKAMSTSIDAQQYISFVLNHPLCNIVARPRRPFSDHTIYHEQFMMVFQIDDQFIENLNVKEVLNDFWHSFSFYLHNTYTNIFNALPECASSISGSLAGTSPFTPATAATLQNDRALIAAVYSELSFLIYRLEIVLKERITNPLYPLNDIDEKIVNALIHAKGYIPEKFNANCTEFVKGFARAREWLIGELVSHSTDVLKAAQDEQCYLDLTCADYSDPICQTIAWAASAIRKCRLYGDKFNVNIFNSFEFHLKNFTNTIYSSLKDRNFATPIAVRKDAFPSHLNWTDAEKMNAFSEYMGTYMRYRTGLTECDAILHELGPAVTSLASYEPLNQAYQKEVIKWMGPCSNGTVADIVAQFDTKSTHGSSSLYSSGINSLLAFTAGFIMTFVGLAMKHSLETSNPNMSRNITKACQLLVSIAAACYSLADFPLEYKVGFVLINAALLAINEHYKCLSRETAINAVLAVSSFGLFAISKSRSNLELATSVCTSVAGGIVGQIASEKVFGKPKMR